MLKHLHLSLACAAVFAGTCFGAKPSKSDCTVLGVPGAFTAGTPLETSASYQGFGNELDARLTTIAGHSVIITAVGHLNSDSTFGQVQVYFLDRWDGHVLDGTFGQPHLAMDLPVWLAHGELILEDLNSDQVPDILIASRNSGAFVFLGATDADGFLSYGQPVSLVPDAGSNPTYGRSIAVADVGSGARVIAVGAPCNGCSHAQGAGEVFLFQYQGGAFAQIQTLADPSDSTSDSFGMSVAFGDVGGSPSPELIVGAPGTQGTGGRSTDGAGRAWIYSLSGTQFGNPAYLITNTKDDALGDAAATGNLGLGTAGYSDLLVVAGNSSNPRGLLYPGPASSPSSLTLTPLSGTMATAFPTDVALGDINGDGVDDVMIGSQQASPGSGCGAIGAAYVYLSPEFAPSTLQPTEVTQNYGRQVAPVDGTRLFLVSAPLDKQVYIYKVN